MIVIDNKHYNTIQHFIKLGTYFIYFIQQS